jgi:hypothetical protein
MKMKLYSRRIFVAILITLFPTAIALAHHSVASGFDMSKEIIVSGTVKSIEWINPHARIFLDVTNVENESEVWTAWLSGANMLLRRGWGSNDLPIGQLITVDGFRARDGSSEMYGGKIRLLDGRTLFSGVPSDER